MNTYSNNEKIKVKTHLYMLINIQKTYYIL